MAFDHGDQQTLRLADGLEKMDDSERLDPPGRTRQVRKHDAPFFAKEVPAPLVDLLLVGAGTSRSSISFSSRSSEALFETERFLSISNCPLHGSLHPHPTFSTDSSRNLFGFVAGHDFAKIEGMIILLGIKACIATLVKMGRIHGGLVDDLAFIMAPGGFDYRRCDLAAIDGLQIALLELVHVPAGVQAAIGGLVVHVSRRDCNRKILGRFDDPECVPA